MPKLGKPQLSQSENSLAEFQSLSLNVSISLAQPFLAVLKVITLLPLTSEIEVTLGTLRKRASITHNSWEHAWLISSEIPAGYFKSFFIHYYCPLIKPEYGHAVT